MSVIDPHCQQLTTIHDEMKRAPNFGVFLQLQQKKFQLQDVMRKEWDELARLTRGWIFVPPKRC